VIIPTGEFSSVTINLLILCFKSSEITCDKDEFLSVVMGFCNIEFNSDNNITKSFD